MTCRLPLMSPSASIIPPLPRNLILTCDINSLMFVFDANDKRLSRCDTGISAYLTAPAYVPSDFYSPIQPYKHSQR